MTWSIHGTVAAFHIGGYAGDFDFTRPDLGLRLRSAGGPAGRYLAVQFPEPSRVRASDCYTRVDDLVLMYPQTAERPFNIQLQYRLFAGSELETRFPEHPDLPRPAAPGLEDSLLIELWISNFTFLLDTHPELDTHCFTLDDDEASLLQFYEADGGDASLAPCATAESDGASIAAAVLSGRPGRPTAAAVIVHPMDQLDSQLLISGDDGSGAEEAAVAVKLRLFGRFMEKGVIRRARLRLLISPSEITESILAAHYDRFAASPLPLTT